MIDVGQTDDRYSKLNEWLHSVDNWGIKLMIEQDPDLHVTEFVVHKWPGGKTFTIFLSNGVMLPAGTITNER